LRPIIFSLEPAPPFSLEWTVWALRRRPDNAVDRWDGETYRRALSMTSEFVEAARKRGILINCTQGNVLRFLPPLALSNRERELDRKSVV